MILRVLDLPGNIHELEGASRQPGGTEGSDYALVEGLTFGGRVSTAGVMKVEKASRPLMEKALVASTSQAARIPM